LAFIEALFSLSPTPPAFIASFCLSFLSLIYFAISSSDGRGAASGCASYLVILGGMLGPAFGFSSLGAPAGVGASAFSGLASSVALVEFVLFSAFGAAFFSSTTTILGDSFAFAYSCGASGFFSQLVILHQIHIKKSSIINMSACELLEASIP
jgi:hypothetical protein